MAEEGTLQEMIREAAEEVGDDVQSLICFYVPKKPDERFWAQEVQERKPLRCSFDELPRDTYSVDYGGVEGPPFVAFSEHYVYVTAVYDGSEWITTVPRHPESVGSSINNYGGG